MTNPTTKSTTKVQPFWMEQCVAAEIIRDRFGLDKALVYLIGEKLFTWISISERQPEFAAELPKIAAVIGQIFKPAEIRQYLDELKRKKYRRPWVSDSELQRFSVIRELLKS
jgi:hypothetical protein